MATKTRELADFILEEGIGGDADIAIQSKPHIIPGVLYPAVANKMVDGTTALSAVTTGPNSSTVASSKYGTVQSDGRMYYYTDIKGSKPIKDPRIGSHFGSQRHKFKSLQLLEQETATHGSNVYSIDGREWLRATGAYILQYNINGTLLYSGATSTPSIEITGYFSSLNLLGFTATFPSGFVLTIDGVAGSETNTFVTSVTNPLGNRYVDRASVANIVTGQTLGIHTLKITDHANADENYFYGIELIAQDTTSTATKSKVQIPSQNVVSFGKKFTVGGSSAHTHYDPFNGFTNGTTLHSAVVDTATSLGLSSAPGSSASWAISGSNNIRPYNGGRVVKWVDSSGTIKTSVNMMPPNAQNIGPTAAAEITTPSATNTAFLPAFSDDAVDHSQAEVAKTFHWREFGNGNANGGSSGTYADASMLNSENDIAHVIDDGLTSLTGDNVTVSTSSLASGLVTSGSDHFYFTFIGTGFSWHGTPHAGGTNISWENVAQNLFYGTHTVKLARDGSDNYSAIIDGVTVYNVHDGFFHQTDWMTIHQPKMPPIPDDAVIIADYMLMADFVANTSAGMEKISKGVRFCASTRDVFYNAGANFSLSINNMAQLGGYTVYNNNSAKDIKLPFFGHGITGRMAANTDRSSETIFKINDDVYDTNFNSAGNYVAGNRVGTSSPNPWDTSNNDGTFTFDQNTNGNESSESIGVKGLDLGLNTVHLDDNTSDYIVFTGFEIHNPIHTSSHYQTFETPYLHELVGGDRNMEQTNLVVTPDGKTWDEVTRDTSYIGNKVMETAYGGGNGSLTPIDFDMWRGTHGASRRNFMQKDWAIACNRYICLRAGSYRIRFNSYDHSGALQVAIRKNAVVSSTMLANMVYSRVSAADNHVHVEATEYFSRGDFFTLGSVSGNMDGTTATPRTSFSIHRV